MNKKKALIFIAFYSCYLRKSPSALMQGSFQQKFIYSFSQTQKLLSVTRLFGMFVQGPWEVFIFRERKLLLSGILIVVGQIFRMVHEASSI